MTKPTLPQPLDFFDLVNGVYTERESNYDYVTLAELERAIYNNRRLDHILDLYNSYITTQLLTWEREVVGIYQLNQEIEEYKKHKEGRRLRSGDENSDIYPTKEYIQYPDKPQAREFKDTAQATLYRLELKKYVDRKSGELRQRLISQGNYLNEEYAIVARYASEWLEDTAREVPRAVSEYAEIYNLSDVEAAKIIVDKNHHWEQVLLDIRRIRLNASAIFTQVDSEGKWVHDLTECQTTRRKVDLELAEFQVKE